MTGIALVGTGFVADYYMTTLANHPQLRMMGAFDGNAQQLDRFATYYRTRKYESLEAVLADPAVEIVVNLTSPEAHYAISRAAFEAGKHVYSEKPLAGSHEEAADLLSIARSRGLILAGAPANALTELHGEVKRLVAQGAIGAPKLVYAEMEDGAVFRDKWRTWRSVSGAQWPGEHEFVVGCTLEHAVYALSWLVSLLGPADSMTAYSALCFPDKGQSGTKPLGPDFSVALINFRSGAVARLTSGLTAPKDRSLTIMGDGGTITVDDLWNYRSTARIERVGEPRPLTEKIAARVERHVGLTFRDLAKPGRRIVAPATRKPELPAFPSQIDFSRGIAVLAEAINGGPMPFLSGDMAVHVTELALAISGAGKDAQPYRVRSLR